MTDWQPIETAPKDIVSSGEFGPRILAYPVFGRIATIRWWQSKDGDPRYRNFLEDGGNACRPSHWMPLPEPPK